MEWINVKDRLPTIKGFYIVCCNHREECPRLICLNFYDNGKFSEHKVVTHWMPLPCPPKKKHKNKGGEE